jgi:hypothetical protein
MDLRRDCRGAVLNRGKKLEHFRWVCRRGDRCLRGGCLARLGKGHSSTTEWDCAVTFAAKIDPIAIYAAVLSTIVFIWNVFVWWGTGPLLKVSASSNMKMFGPGARDNSSYLLANVGNVGTQQTTITHVIGFAYRNRWDRVRNKPAEASSSTMLCRLIRFPTFCRRGKLSCRWHSKRRRLKNYLAMGCCMSV